MKDNNYTEILSGREVSKRMIICPSCGNDTFRVYCGSTFDDAHIYCSACDCEVE